MLVVRFRETFRERMPEWVLATGMLCWGLLSLVTVNSFESMDFFKSLLEFMPQMAWGILAMLVGAIRLVFLVINGAWRPSAHIRAVGCFVGSIFWGTLFLASLKLGWMSPNAAMFATLLGLDVISLWFSAGDAKLADLLAKGKLKAG